MESLDSNLTFIKFEIRILPSEIGFEKQMVT